MNTKTNQNGLANLDKRGVMFGVFEKQIAHLLKILIRFLPLCLFFR